MVWVQAYNIQGQSMKKGDRSRPFVRVRKGLLAFLGGLFLLWFRSFLLVRSLVELVGHEHHAVVLYAFVVLPLLRLEVALDGDHGSLGELVEGSGVLVLAPGLDVHEG